MKKLELLIETNRRNSNQLICFLHGPGGSGKTAVIDLVMEYAREYCSYMNNFEFNARTIVVTAMTGVAATLLLGETTHSALYLNQLKGIEREQVELWMGARFLIIDEISFAGKKIFVQIHKNLQHLRQCLGLPYGGINIVFSGDLRQLEPIGIDAKPVYTEDCPEFKDWVNCYIELHGMHRFKDDLPFGLLLFRFRDGEVTLDDIRELNEQHVVTPDTILPHDIKYVTYQNRDRDAINAALFEERCNYLYNKHGTVLDAVMIFADHVKVRNGSRVYVPFRNLMTFWQNCGENDVLSSRVEGRMDPVLRLYHGCRIMLPCNKDVTAGQANGTQATVETIVLKPGIVPRKVVLHDDVSVFAVLASEVSHVVLRHSSDRVQPQLFSVEPKKYTFWAKLPKPKILQTKGKEREELHLKAVQLPILINNATTGHKLQGSGVDNLFVHDWKYITNWPYVVLSRVRTHMGLFFRKALSTDLTKYAMPKALHKMLEKFRSTRSPTYWNDDEYEELFPST